MEIKQRLYVVIIFLIITLGFYCCSTADDDLIVYPSSLISPDRVIVHNAYNDSLGRVNAVKKAYQMTNLSFTPLAPIGHRFGFFEAKRTYRGVIYSSVKEMEMFVGNNISIHTYMTAIHNPRSKIYTEDVSQFPYHGENCRTYYGAICSSFVSYALGIIPRYWANDFSLSNLMQKVDFSNLDSLKIADVLWRNGHVAMITDIKRNENGQIDKIEICECKGKGCQRNTRSREDFIELMNTSFNRIYRYIEIYKNVEYTPIPEFVAVLDENPVPFKYNDDLCVDKGDKSCYLEEEEVIVNVQHPYDFIEIYRNGELYNTVDTQDEDVKLVNLPYGDYKARIFYNGQYSDYTYWMVVNVNVKTDRVNKRIYFSSANAKPQYIRYCDISGSDGLLNTSYRHILSQEEKLQGYIDVLSYEIHPLRPYIHIFFLTDYGRIINKPINWYD